MNKSHIRRLEELQTLMINPKKVFGSRSITFDMEDFIGPNAAEQVSEFPYPKEVQSISNTSACALGMSVLHKPFTDEGLTFVKNLGKISGVPTLTVHFAGKDHFEAAAKFFGIGKYDAHFIFDCHAYGTLKPKAIKPIMVADRVQEILEHYKADKAEMFSCYPDGAMNAL